MAGYINRIDTLLSDVTQGLRQKFEARIASESDDRYLLVELELTELDSDFFTVTALLRSGRGEKNYTERVSCAAAAPTASSNMLLVSPKNEAEINELRGINRKSEADFWEQHERYKKDQFSDDDFAAFSSINPAGALAVQAATFGRGKNIEELIKISRQMCETADYCGENKN